VDARSRISWSALWEVRFSQGLSVYEKSSVLYPNDIARNTDNTLNRKVAIHGITDNNDFGGARQPEMEYPTVEKVRLLIGEGGRHAQALNLH